MLNGMADEPVTSEEQVESIHLPRWIRQNCNLSKGGGAKFEHLLEPWEEQYYGQGLEDDAETEDIEDGGNEEEDIENESNETEGTEEEDTEEKDTEEEDTEEKDNGGEGN